MGKQLQLWIFSKKFIWKSRMENRAIFRALSVFIRDSSAAVLLFFLTRACTTIKGWNFYEILLCLAHQAISYGILLIFFTGIRDYWRDVDKYFLKPAGVLWQMLLERMDWYAFFGHFCRGILFLVIACVGCKVEFTVVKGIFFVLNLAGGVLIQAAFWVIIQTLNMVIKTNIYWKKILYFFPRTFTEIPISWFPASVVNFFTFIMPWGFVCFYPTLQLLGRNEGMPEVLWYLALPVGIVLYLLAYGIWRLGLYVYRK